MFKFVFLWTDVAMWLMVLAVGIYGVAVARSPRLSRNWRRVFTNTAALSSSLILLVCVVITLLDSVHFRRALPPMPGATSVAYDVRTTSLLDLAVPGLISSRERAYSRPLTYLGFFKESIDRNGKVEREHPRLKFGGAHLKDPQSQWIGDVLLRGGLGAAGGMVFGLFIAVALIGVLSWRRGEPWRATASSIRHRQSDIPWHAALWTVGTLSVLIGMAISLSTEYHVLGTDRTGNDVLYQALKSIRTAFVIGTLATVATLPLAVGLGILAGYLKGWVDEVIQYIYTLLSSVPGVLLIAACVLMVQVFLDKHPELFETGAERADLKLFLLCGVLGVTGWTGLCRLLRGETLKLRELEYVQAATAFGVSRWRIMLRHILPNVAHLMLIVTVLEFSGLILYEAVLSYVGVGVDPSMNSFGGMINLARNEMSADPLVWWPFSAAFVFMVTVVLAANLFADGVRDAFDPRATTFRVRFKPLNTTVTR